MILLAALGRLGSAGVRNTNRFSTPGYTPPTAAPTNKQQQRYSCVGTPHNGTDFSTSLAAGSVSSGSGVGGPQALHRSALYVLGDKAQMKVKAIHLFIFLLYVLYFDVIHMVSLNT